MRPLNSLFRCAIVLGLAAGLGGCGKAELSGFLEPYDGFQKISPISEDLEYVREGVAWQTYGKVRIAQVVTCVKPREGYRAVDPDELKHVTDLLETHLVDAFGRSFEVTTSPGPGVLDVRVAVTRLRPTDQAANVASWVVPGSFVVTTAYRAATNSNLALGEAGIEAEFVDSETGVRDYGFVGMHMGSSIQLQQITRWGIAEEAMAKWARRLAGRLEELKKSGEMPKQP